MLQAILEILFQIFFEAVLQLIIEVLIEWGMSTRTFKAIKSSSDDPLVVGIGYLAIGVILGTVSGFFIPIHLISNGYIRMIMLFMSPVGLGLMLCLVSWVFNRRYLGEELFSLPKFLHGFIFGAAYSASRFVMIVSSVN